MNSNKELWQTVYDWLLLSGNRINNNYCKEEITTHPDYPALTSVIDFLDSGGMEYKVIQANASYIHEFNYPLLAHIKQFGQEYMQLITDASVWDNEKEITQYWTGVAVYPEKYTHWQNEQNNVYQSNAVKNKIFAVVLSSLGFALFMVSAFHSPNFLKNLFGLFSLIGLIVSIFLLGTELGFQSQIIKQVCGAVSNGGCEKVLKSNYAKGVAGITPADASVLYFAAQFIIFLLSCWYPAFLGTILLLAFSGIAIAVWSIYTQAVKLKQYCALCLSIVAVLVLQFITTLFIIQQLMLNEISSSIFIGLGSFIAFFSVLALILLPIKQLMKTNSSNKLKLAELKKWRLDADLFINQWQNEQEVDTTIWENDLLMGDSNVPIILTVACNLYCQPCAEAHKKLENILQHYPNKVKIQLRLLSRSHSEDDKKIIAMRAVLRQSFRIQNNLELIKMVNDWFELMDIEKWKAKWPIDDAIDVDKRLYQHHEWVKNSAIAFTPTIFINGHKVPSRYSLDDLEILIPQLAEQIII